jgi:hypothetical protein
LIVSAPFWFVNHWTKQGKSCKIANALPPVKYRFDQGWRRRVDSTEQLLKDRSETHGVAARPIHSHGAILQRSDYDRAVRLLQALVDRLDAATVAALTG